MKKSLLRTWNLAGRYLHQLQTDGCSDSFDPVFLSALWIARAQRGQGMDKRGRKIFGSILGESLLDGSLTPEQLAKAVQAMKEVGNKFHVLTAYRTLINKKSKLPTLDEIREEITSRVGAKFRMPKSTIHYILSNVYKLPCRGVGRPW